MAHIKSFIRDQNITGDFTLFYQRELVGKAFEWVSFIGMLSVISVIIQLGTSDSNDSGTENIESDHNNANHDSSYNNNSDDSGEVYRLCT